MTPIADPSRGPDPKPQGPFSGFAVFPPPEPDPGEDAPEPRQAPAAEDSGPLSGFSVYDSPEDDPAGEDGAADDNGAPEERYVEPEDVPPGHEIRMRPGSSLSINHRNVYRTDRRGVPHFAAGWSPAAAGIHYRRTALGAAALAVAAAAGCILMSLTGVGSDNAYTELASDGVRTPAVVSGVQRTTIAGEGLSPSYVTVEETTFRYDADGSRAGTVRTETTDSLPPVARETQWQEGESADIFVSTDDPDAFTPVDPEQPGRVNALTLFPLVPMAGFAVAAVSARRKKDIMDQLEKVDWKHRKQASKSARNAHC